MVHPTPCTYLFVPGNRPDRFDKALASGADAVIIDLEDAVPEPEKEQAREAVERWLRPAQPVLVRINSVDSSWFKGDLKACRRPGVAGIVLPKTESASHVQIVREQVGESLRVLPLIETARGLWNALETARAPGVERLIFGSIDFELDLGMQAEPEELSAFQCQLVLVSRVAGIGPPVDGITPAINDMERLRADALRARRLGFSGKLCIHPRQVACVRECFEPSAAEIAWAKRVVEAASAACGAAVAVDGRMVDRPAVLRAEQILAKLS